MTKWRNVCVARGTEPSGGQQLYQFSRDWIGQGFRAFASMTCDIPPRPYFLQPARILK